MLPNLRHLQCFREIARLGSLGAAARAMHLSQPAVTQAVAGLESHFGTQLLARRPDGVSPTPAGEVCLVRIDRALAQLREALADTRIASGEHPPGLDPEVLTHVQAVATALKG